jgi:hypothetical protein
MDRTKDSSNQPNSDMRYVLLDIERQRRIHDRWRFRLGVKMATLIVVVILILKGNTAEQIKAVWTWLFSLF